MSPKGGVGKTTVATNLAVGLAQIAPMGVVIVDLDLQFGDVASGLMLEPVHTITEAVVGAASQDSMVLKTYLTRSLGRDYTPCALRETQWKWTASLVNMSPTSSISCGRNSSTWSLTLRRG